MKKILFLTIVLSLVMVFSCGALASEDVPSVTFSLLTDNAALEYTATGTSYTCGPSWMFNGIEAKVVTVGVPIGTSWVKITSGYNLDSDYVLHTITNTGTPTERIDLLGGYVSYPVKKSVNDCYLMLEGAYDGSYVGELYIIYFVEVSNPTVTNITSTPVASYVGNNTTCKIGATVEYATNDTPAKVFLTDKEEGTSADAIEGTLVETTVAELTSVEIPIGNLDAGKYWIAAESGEDILHQEFIVHETAKEYAEASLDRFVSWYSTSGFYSGADYVGLSADSGNGSGIDWEAYIFGALGYSADSRLLSSFEGKTYLDMMTLEYKDMPLESLVKDQPPVPAAKILGREILGIAGLGGDPRNIGRANLVEALIAVAYENNDIEGGKLKLDEDGSLRVRLAENDTIAESYLLLALEVVNATEEEGYTEELRAAGLKTLIKACEGMDLSEKTNMSDFYSMTLFACEFLNDVEGMEGEAQKLLDAFHKNYAAVIDNSTEVADPLQKMNANSIAVATTVLVGSGVTFEEYVTDEAWENLDGRDELYALLYPQAANGNMGSNENDNRMVNYQVLQALTDLLNGKTCFRVAHETYMENYPQYSDDYAPAKVVEDQIADIGAVSLDSKEAIEAARAAYDALTEGQKSLVENADALVSAETIYGLLAALEEQQDKLEEQQGKLDNLTGELDFLQKPGADQMKDLTDKTAWYYNAVDWAIKTGFFNGDDQGNFNPAKDITRAEFAQMLYNYYKDDASVMKDGEAVSYNDVAEGAWYYDAVTACSKAGIFKGDDNGNFNPNAPITRQDTALVMMRIFIGEEAIDAIDVDARLAELKDVGMEFADFDETASYAQKAMVAAAGVIFNGDQNGNLNPTENITRAETATVLFNAFTK